MGKGNVRVKGADRTSVFGGGQNGQSFAAFGTVHLALSVSRHLSLAYYAAYTNPAPLRAFMSGEVTDLLTMAGEQDGRRKARSIGGSVEKREIKGEISSRRILQPSFIELTNHPYQSLLQSFSFGYSLYILFKSVLD